MANMGPNTNTAHFSIMMGPAHHLDGHYTIFGEVVSFPLILGGSCLNSNAVTAFNCTPIFSKIKRFGGFSIKITS